MQRLILVSQKTNTTHYIIQFVQSLNPSTKTGELVWKPWNQKNSPKSGDFLGNQLPRPAISNRGEPLRY